jgi:hypothetical protein
MLLAVLTAHAQPLERYPRPEPKAQKKDDLKQRCADALARIGRLHAERRGSRDQNRNIPEIERLGRFVDTQCPPG